MTQMSNVALYASGTRSFLHSEEYVSRHFVLTLLLVFSHDQFHEQQRHWNGLERKDEVVPNRKSYAVPRAKEVQISKYAFFV